MNKEPATTVDCPYCKSPQLAIHNREYAGQKAGYKTRWTCARCRRDVTLHMPLTIHDLKDAPPKERPL
jgi:transposase-like protein